VKKYALYLKSIEYFISDVKDCGASDQGRQDYSELLWKKPDEDQL